MKDNLEEAPQLTPAQMLGEDTLEEVSLPMLNVKMPISALCVSVVKNMPHKPEIFRRKDTYVTIHTEERRNRWGMKSTDTFTREMTISRLITYIEKFMAFRNGADEKSPRTSLGKAKAEIIMSSDAWYNAIPELREVANVRLPIWVTRDGKRSIELAPVGYDPETKIFTADCVPYPTEKETLDALSPEECRAIWQDCVSGYPFFIEDDDDRRHAAAVESAFRTRRDAAAAAGVEFTECADHLQRVDVCRNRSACVALAAMLGQYCRHLVDRAPMLIVNANQPGTGKSHLAWYVLSPTWGTPPGSPCPTDEAEMSKVLTSALIEGAPFYMFDDIASLNSSTINLFTTSSTYRARLLASNKTVTLENRCQLIATGNALTMTPDIERRSLIVDLWLGTRATERKFKSIIAKEDFAEPSRRAGLLTFLAALVHNWVRQGMPILCTGNEKPSFETYAQVVGSIMLANGFANPFRPRQSELAGGDLIGRTLELLMAHLAMEIPSGRATFTFNLRHFEALAIRKGWKEILTGAKKDFGRSLGRRLIPYRNRTMTDTKGRPFIFGKGEDAGSSNYTFVRTFAPDPEEEPPLHIVREVAAGHIFPDPYSDPEPEPEPVMDDPEEEEDYTTPFDPY